MMETVQSRRMISIVFCVLCLFLYAYGLASAPYVPSHIEGIALPLDFMVGIPLGFYLLIIRPKKLTLLSVIPVIWFGYALSVFALGSVDAGVLPYLLTLLIPVELAIAIRECLKIARVYKAAKRDSIDPMLWFRKTMLYLVRQDMSANMAAAELSVWYYALFSWRQKPYMLSGEKAFTYHNAGGYMNMMLGLALAFPIEIIGVHILISQWSLLAASIVTALSVYAAIWFIGDARARMMRPIAIDGDRVRLECGIQMEALIPLSDIERICFSQNDVSGLQKTDVLNYGTFYQANVWIVTKQPISVQTLFGLKQARAIGISVDDPKGLMREMRNE